MTLADFLVSAINKLKHAEIDNPQLDVRILVGHALGLNRVQLLTESARVLSAEDINVINTLLSRRIAHESVARIIGKREFWGLDFGLNEATLEPRPDSETLVEAVVRLRRKPKRILDLGTGTGCLLLALLHEVPDATGIGIDINPRAILQATKNAFELGLSERSSFRAGDWFTGIQESFDIIVSNPPYIPSSDILTLMPEVRDYDPMLALDGGQDGVAVYCKLIEQLKNYLIPNGLAAFEVGQGQAEYVAKLFQKEGFINVTAHKDLNGIERCITAER